jgi:hypothetical protein
MKRYDHQPAEPNGCNVRQHEKSHTFGTNSKPFRP